MSGHGGGESTPAPPFTADDVFKKLVNRLGKKTSLPEVPKFIKKLNAISKITLLVEQPIKIARALEERGLVG